jgi:hypothetical protein
MEPWSAETEAEYKVEALVKGLVEFAPALSIGAAHVFEVDGYRILVRPDYENFGSVAFRIYKIAQAKDMVFVRSGTAKEVFDILPERFAQAMIFQLDLLQ